MLHPYFVPMWGSLRMCIYKIMLKMDGDCCYHAFNMLPYCIEQNFKT